MHTYRAFNTPQKGWSVGYWLPSHKVHGGPMNLWEEISFVDNELVAAIRVNILNGGTGAIYWKGFLSHEPIEHGEGRF